METSNILSLEWDVETERRIERDRQRAHAL
jgi:hypothetical protein